MEFIVRETAKKRMSPEPSIFRYKLRDVRCHGKHTQSRLLITMRPLLLPVELPPGMEPAMGSSQRRTAARACWLPMIRSLLHVTGGLVVRCS